MRKESYNGKEEEGKKQKVEATEKVKENGENVCLYRAHSDLELTSGPTPLMNLREGSGCSHCW